ncbi:hypothetical protein T484DRAFT_1981944, partial [Baffinella frigidus]
MSHANQPVTAARLLDDRAPTQGRRQRHRPGSCHNGPLHPSPRSSALHLCRGGQRGEGLTGSGNQRS